MATQVPTLQLLAREVGRALAALERHLAPDELLPFFASLGLQFPPDLMNQPAFTNAANLCVTSASAIPQIVDELSTAIANDDVGDTVIKGVRLIEQIKNVITALDDLKRQLQLISNSLPGISADDVNEFAEDLPARVLELMLIDQMASRLPNPTLLLALFGIIEHSVEPGDPADPTKPAFVSQRLRLARFVDAVRSPGKLLKSIYGWGDGAFDGEALLAQLHTYMIRSGAEAELRPATPGSPLTLESRVFKAVPDATTNPPGLLVTTFVPLLDGLNLTLPLFPDWRLELQVQGRFESELQISFVPLAQLTLLPPTPPLTGQIFIRIVGEATDSEPFMLLGQTGASRLEAKSLKFSFGLLAAIDESPASSRGELLVQAEIVGGRAVISTSGGDGFLTELTSGKDLNSQFDLRASWGLEQGLTFQGSSGIEISIPQHLTFGPIELAAINLISSAASQDRLPLEISTNLRTRLGPLLISVNRLGFEIVLAFPDAGGNLGPLDLDLDFKPPNELGLSIDGGGFKGGGFLEFEPEEARYSGMLELEFQDQFTLKAFGLLNTRLPNGQSGFSLLIIISSEFTPIQLGLGFKLNGVGGLLGLNRTINIEPLRTGLRDNTLSSILFPTDIVANADRIISDLRQVFPPMAERFIFGPMAKITWGTPTLVTVDLGLVIEVPEPIRLAILGVLRAVLPDENAAILRVQVNFLGEVNFERRQLKFDASLFDSKLLGFTLSGDMALRLDWGADANFLLTVGGFHPAYQPPAMDLPAIRRLTLSLLEGDNPRLKLEMYFAVTSNTAQFGARLELYAAAWKFNVYGFLTFDVLFQFNPFYFIAEITAMLALRVGSSSFASIKLTLTLEGPTPWKAQGTAKFKICWFFTLKVRFNKTFGETRNTTLPDVAVLPLLRAALEANDNWEGELPPQRHRLESIRETPGALLVHPVGTLKVSQKVVPLKVRIDRLGSQRPSDGREFAIVDVQPTPNPEAVEESFAPAQYFDLTDEEKLTSPSFRQFESGVRIGDPERLHTGYAAVRHVEYELKYIDSQREQRLAKDPKPFPVDVVSFHTWTLSGAIAQSPLSFARNRKSSLAPEAVAVSQEQFAIVNTGDLTLFDELSVLGNERAAAARLKVLLEQNPSLRGTLQVVPAFELAA